MRVLCWPCLPEQDSGCLALNNWCDHAMSIIATAECMSCATMPFPLTKPDCVGSQQQRCQRSLLAAELIRPHCRYKSSIGVKELMHFFDATHTSINAVDKAEAESSSPHSITPKTPVRTLGSGGTRAKRGKGRPSMRNNSKHATRQALRFTCRKRARVVPTPAPDVGSERAQTTSASAAHPASATDAAAAADTGSKRLKASPLTYADSRPAEASACADAANDSRPAEASACADAAYDSTATLMVDADSNQAQTVAMPSAADVQCNTDAAARRKPETAGSSGDESSSDVVQSIHDARLSLRHLLQELAAGTPNGADKITIVPADTSSEAGWHKVCIGLAISEYLCLCEQQSIPDGIMHACVTVTNSICSSTCLMSLPKDASRLQQLSLQ